ncbi:hypothetical protein ACSFE6_01555 [Pseudomonas baetica]|uniref:hypothetical protein n=1 Tax=Pseudomonas baetica TaxID=674054 RepID=UPI003EE82AFF
MFEIKPESSGLRRTGPILLCPWGRPYVSVSRINRKKKPEARALQKQKPTPFPQKERRKEERRDRCFFVVLKYKDPSLKNFFKGAIKKIFLLTWTEK